ncbi:MAG: glycosyltransferase family 4 protein [Bryobacterales bacterium]|jgi:glycosyltransferase involved in cell wall biosynthesis|nr:glycosyltransferase family 4 protein [Bryobacterales bacterium]
MKSDSRIPRPIRLAILMEAASVTGPAKNLFAFLQNAGDQLDPLLITFVRHSSATMSAPSNLFLDAARERGIRVAPIAEGFRFDPRVLPPLRSVLAEFSPHILQSHNVKSNFFVRALGLHRKYPWVAFHHGYTKTSRMMEVYDQLDRWSMRGARRVVTVCGPFVQQLTDVGIPLEMIWMQHNSVRPAPEVDPGEIAALRDQLGIAPEEQVVLTVGRLSKEKAQDDLVRAVAMLKPRQPRLRLVLVGEGPQREALGALASQLGLTDIVFAGLRTQVTPFYAMATVFVLPSHSEGSPNVILEAMAAGTPIVATSVGGVPELVEHQRHALLAPPAQHEALAQGIAQVLEDAQLRKRITAAARSRITESFTPEAYCSRLLAFYQELLSHP